MADASMLHHLFWTGGWDSTFRLLQVLLILKEPIQPHYLIDPKRASTAAELHTQERIRQHLLDAYPNAGTLLPAKFFNVAELPSDPEIRISYLRLREISYLGEQYMWAANYAVMENLRDVELSAQYGGRIAERLGPYIQPFGDGLGINYRLDPQYNYMDMYKIFGRFSFPILKYSKLTMEQVAREAGFLEVMYMTWFCHNPQPDGSPCGVCNPCSFTIQEGLGWRIPLHRRVRYYLPGPAMFRRIASQNRKIYRVLYRLKMRLRSDLA